ncbi:MAG TPA: ankyrin repeat domain-containing protein [Abditibacteriaceae bacterium]|jgi:cytohesin
MKRFLLPMALLACAPLAPTAVYAQLEVRNTTPPIFDAITKGDLAAVKDAIEKDPTAAKAMRYGSSALTTAIERRNKEIVALLIEKGADVNEETYSGNVLDRALSYGENREMAALLIEKGADMEKRDREGKTILMRRASSGGNREILEWLLEKGAKVSTRDDKGQSALDYAIQNGNADVVTALLDKGADVKTRDDNGRTPLHNAVSRGIANVVKVILDKGADINAASETGETPLHLAASTPGPILNSLLASGANPNVRNKRGDAPLHIALRAQGEPFGYLPGSMVPGMRFDGFVPGVSGGSTATPRAEGVLLTLLDKTDVSLKDGLGLSSLLLAIAMRDGEARDIIIERKPKLDSTTQLFDAVAQGDVPTLEKILAAKPFLVYFRLPNGLTPLHVSALWGTRSAAEVLLKKGADKEARDAAGSSPLMMTAGRSSGVFTKRARLMAALLLEKGADINARDRHDATTLHRAVVARDAETVAALVAKGADVNARDRSGVTVLHLLANTREGTDGIAESAIAKQVLAAKANPNIRNTSGFTPLALAVSARRVDFTKMLLDAGANVDTRDGNGYTPLARLISNSYSYSSDSSNNKSNKEIATLLLDKGADPNARTEYNNDNLLSRAVSNGNKEFVALLIAKKVNVEMRNSSGYTPLMVAIYNGSNNQKEIVEQLLTAGADANAKNSSGESVLKMAKRHGNKDILAALEAKGAKE